MIYLGDDCKVAYAWQKWCLQQEFKEKFHGLKVYQPRAGGGTVCSLASVKNILLLKSKIHFL